MIEPLPEAGAKVGLPQPEVVGVGVGATTIRPGIGGKLSVKATPVNVAVALGFVIVKVKVMSVVTEGAGLGEKLFEKVGGKICTLNGAVAGLVLLPPFVVVKLPAAIVFVYVPVVEAVTFTAITQLLLPAIVPPLN